MFIEALEGRRLLSVASDIESLIGPLQSDNRPHLKETFVTHLSGDEEVPARDTRAQGQVIFHLSKDGTALAFKLIVANITNVVAAHIHVAPPGVNGGIVADLFGPAAAGGGRRQGVIATGVLTDANVRPGNTIASILEAIRDGNAYVNVHTSDGVGAPDSGPGDFPGGEVRGQL